MHLHRWLLLLTLLVLGGCVTAGTEAFKTAQELADQNRYEDAVKYYQAALEKDPGNEEYAAGLARARRQAARAALERARDVYDTSPRDHHSLTAVLDDLDKALKFDPDNDAAKTLRRKVAAEDQALLEQVEELYRQVRTDLDAGRAFEAVTKIEKIKKRFPGYEDIPTLEPEAWARAKEICRKQGAAAFRGEDFAAAIRHFDQCLHLDPDDAKAKRFRQAAVQRNSIDYFLAKADKAIAEQRYDDAYEALAKAERFYGTGNTAVTQRRQQVVTALSNDGLRRIRKARDRDRLYLALDAIGRLLEVNPEIVTNYDFFQLKDQVLDRAFQKAKAYEEAGMYGNAYSLYARIKELNPSYPDIFYTLQGVEDKINARVRRSIAIMDFGSPSNAPDAGTILSNSLTTYLFKVASADIQILERSDIQPLLDELHLSQTGMFDLRRASTAKALQGIDYFIFGNVLNYEVTTETVTGKRYAKLEIGTVNKENIEYLNWKARHPHPTEEQLQQAPPAVIEVPQYKEIQYEVTTTKKVAFVDVFYKMIDTAKAEILFTKTEKEKTTVTDDYVSGVPEAGIEDDPLEIPTDKELLEELTTKQVGRMATNILDRLQSLQLEYFQNGQRLQQRKEYEKAIEAYTDAVFDEKIKGLRTEITEKSLQAIDQCRRELER